MDDSFAVHRYLTERNPRAGLTIEQLDQIFSKTHLYSRGENATTWKSPIREPVPVGRAEIKSVGSDTMGDLMRNWADQFRN